MKRYANISFRTYVFAAIVLIIVFAAILLVMGQVPICKCGYVKIWHGVTFSSENSQHLSDWYSFSHIIHGFGFYLLLLYFGRRLPIGLRLVLALLLETSWEIFENTDFIINRYREVTISLDYYGDSVINSVFDVLFMVLGFWASFRFPVWSIILTAIFLEIFVAYFIRDNLTLNIIMLIYPVDAIKIWQGGG